VLRLVGEDVKAEEVATRYAPPEDEAFLGLPRPSKEDVKAEEVATRYGNQWQSINRNQSIAIN